NIDRRLRRLERIAEPDVAARNAADARQDAHDRLRDDRLARPRFADQGRHLAFTDTEARAVHHLKRAAVDIEGDAQVLDAQQVSGKAHDAMPPGAREVPEPDGPLDKLVAAVGFEDQEPTFAVRLAGSL